jgi:Nucleotidyltransferase domain.
MTVPDAAREILDQYFARLNKELPDRLDAFYLFGSVSLDAFQEGFSDLDFAAVTNRPLTEREVRILEQIHHELEVSFPKTSLDGRYVWNEDLESLGDKDCPYHYFNSGRLAGIERLQKDSVDAFQIKYYGIPIIGRDPRSYSYSVDWTVLTRNMKSNLEHYWLNWRRKVEKFPSKAYFGMFIKGWMIEWGVLGVSRIFYSIREHDLISKAGAAHYAMQHVPERWHRILQESINLRSGNRKSLYRSVFKRRQDALAYMDYMIKECLDE